MPTVKSVEAALLYVGELRAAALTGGFLVRQHAGEAVVVYWCPPQRDPASGNALSFLESYARSLRESGIVATLIFDADGPRVLCPGDTKGDTPRGRDGDLSYVSQWTGTSRQNHGAADDAIPHVRRRSTRVRRSMP